MKRFLIFGIILLTLLGGCRRRPKGVLSDSEMESLLTDLALAEAYEQASGAKTLPDSVRNRIGEAVLLKHGVDSARLDATYEWYARNIDDYYKVYDKVERRLQKMRSKVAGVNIGDNSADNLWNLPSHFFFSPLSPASAYVFDLPADKITKGDFLEWKLRLSAPSEVELTLGIDYMDSTISITNRTFRNERSLRLKLLSDTGRVVRRIFGSISADRKEYPLWIDSIALIKATFDSTEYNAYRYQKFLLGAKRIDKTPKPPVNSAEDSIRKPDVGKTSQDTINPAARRAKIQTMKRAEELRNYR